MKGYCRGFVHVVRQGDTLYSISRRYRIPLALILRSNPYVDVYNMQIGQEICIPVIRPFSETMFPGQARETESSPTIMPDDFGTRGAVEVSRTTETPMMAEVPEMSESSVTANMPETAEVPEVPVTTKMPETAEVPTASEIPEMFEVPEADNMPEVTEKSVESDRNNETEQKRVYITESKKSIGSILDEFDISMEEFTKSNDISQVLLAEDVVLYLPKKV